MRGSGQTFKVGLLVSITEQFSICHNGRACIIYLISELENVNFVAKTADNQLSDDTLRRSVDEV